MITFLTVISVFLMAYILVLLGTIKGAEYPRKREVSRTYDIIKATLLCIVAILIMSWALILKTGWQWPW